MSDEYRPKQNQLLAAMPPVEYLRLLPHLELVPMRPGAVLYEPGTRVHHAYFPIDCIVSLRYICKSGSEDEIAMVGREGMVGVSLFLGGEGTLKRAIVRSAGWAYRLPANLLKESFNQNVQVQHLLLRYAQVLLTQMGQIAVCNRHHTLEHQLCRWLLMSFDRLPSNVLVITHELIANMLGVRREGVTEAAGRLQAQGLIECYRGHIKMINRSGLEKKSCECYVVVKKEFDRLLPMVHGAGHTAWDSQPLRQHGSGGLLARPCPV